MKKGMLFFSIICIFILTLLISNISAGIYFSSPDSFYNIGDTVDLSVTVNPFSADYLLKVDLVCQDKSIITFNFMPDTQGKVEIKVPLSYATIKDTAGVCYFKGEYPEQGSVNSRSFEISKKLDVRLSSDAFFVKPGDNLTITGTAKRLNGVGINGEVLAKIPVLTKKISTDEESSGNESSSSSNKTTEANDAEAKSGVLDGVFYGKVINGEFQINLDLREDTPSGDYRIEINSYETLAGKKSSEGNAIASLKIFQVLKSADLALNNQNFDPGKEVSIKPMLLDQAGMPYNDKVSVIITNDAGERVYESVGNSQETVYYKIPPNLSAGNYQVEISSNGIGAKKNFYINEKAIIIFVLENNTLTVTNIGNIPYNNSIQIFLNGQPFVKKLTNLKPGESEKFKLTGKNDKYDIRITDGETELNQNGVPLTGMAVGVMNLSSGGQTKSLISPTLIWILVIIVLALLLFLLFRILWKKRSFAYPIADKFKFDKKTKVMEINEQGRLIKEEKKNEVPLTLLPKTTAVTKAEQVLVLHGEKNRVCVAAIRIKNKLTPAAKDDLQKSLAPFYERKGAIYGQGDYVFAIFSPLVTKSFRNEAEAAKASEKVVETLRDHNLKYRDKIEFGIGINSGDVINKIEGRILKFTVLGNTLIGAKRLADTANEQIFVSKEAFNQGASELKAEKRNVNGTDAYEITRIVDLEKNDKFIKDFLGRQEKEQKKSVPYWNKSTASDSNKNFQPFGSNTTPNKNPGNTNGTKPISFESIKSPPSPPSSQNSSVEKKDKSSFNPNFFNL